MKKNILIIFIKYPEAGQVKTRLAKDIGEKKAVSLYQKLVEWTVASTQSAAYERLIFYIPEDKKQQIADWLGYNLTYLPQEGGDLGERLTNAFKLTFAKETTKKVIVIGSDNPFVKEKLINKAFKCLKNKECVIGPAQDGGYYLLGLCSPNREIFQGIDWGTDKVLAQTQHILNKLNLTSSAPIKLAVTELCIHFFLNMLLKPL